MNDLAKFLAIVFIVCLQVLVGVLVLEHGWGLTPQSWWWIIGGGVVVVVFLRSLSDALIKKDKES